MEEKAMNEQTIKVGRKSMRKYDESFKGRAVELWMNSGKRAEDDVQFTEKMCDVKATIS